MGFIDIINRSDVKLNPPLEKVVAAIQKQIDGEFLPKWDNRLKEHIPTTLRITDMKHPPNPFIALVDSFPKQFPSDGAGFHLSQGKQILGFFNMKSNLAKIGNYSSGLDHEILEMIADPFPGPDTGHFIQTRGEEVLVEVCDPCHTDLYMLDGVKLSNFIFPSWFADGGSPPLDRMGKIEHPLGLRAVGFYWFVKNGKTFERKRSQKGIEITEIQGEEPHLIGVVPKSPKWFIRQQKMMMMGRMMG